MVDKLLYDLVPPGIIVLWYGIIAEIPEDWVLCDGTEGTPDLRDRFVVGAGGNRAVNATGGQSTINGVVNHTHDIAVNESPHNHTQNAHTHIQDAHTHTQNSHNHTQDAHNHTQNSFAPRILNSGTAGTVGVQGASAASNANASNAATTATNQAATATNQAATAVNQNATATNQNATPTNNAASTGITASSANPAGGVASIDITPPFYALAYIMKRFPA